MSEHGGGKFYYTSCNYSGHGAKCNCAEIAAADPGLTVPANRAIAEAAWGPLPDNATVLANYERRYA